MKTLRKLTSVLVLTLMLGLPAFSDDTQPCAPGETHTPPCSGTTTDDMGDPSTPSTTPSTAMAADETFTEIATEVLESMLWIF